MPIRRRKSKRRIGASAPEWAGAFTSHYDFFDELPPVGVPTDQYGRPSLEDAERAWHQFGEQFLATYDEPFEPWALREFGPPNARR